MPYRTVNFTDAQDAEIKDIQAKNPLVSEATVIRMAVQTGLPLVRKNLEAIHGRPADTTPEA